MGQTNMGQAHISFPLYIAEKHNTLKGSFLIFMMRVDCSDSSRAAVSMYWKNIPYVEYFFNVKFTIYLTETTEQTSCS